MGCDGLLGGWRTGKGCHFGEHFRGLGGADPLEYLQRLPEEDLGEVKDATVVLKNGRTARVTMHLIEGTKEEIEATFRESIEAFFEMYPEI